MDTKNVFRRRDLLRSGLALTALGSGVGASPNEPAAVVRDRLWLWGSSPMTQERAKGWGIENPCRMTLAEGAWYLGIPNGVMVRRLTEEPDVSYKQLAVPLTPLKKLVWSVVGPSGVTDVDARNRVLDMAFDTANVAGVMMDDFFFSANRRKTTGQAAALNLQEMEELSRRLKQGPKRLDLWVVMYYHLLANRDEAVQDYMKYFDVLTFWTWNSNDLHQLQANFESAEKLAPNKRKVIGLYFWDYPNKAPVSLERMKHQCGLGLRWLKQGRLDGMLFLSACFCDLKLRHVEWTRDWIREVGDEPVPAITGRS